MGTDEKSTGAADAYAVENATSNDVYVSPKHENIVEAARIEHQMTLKDVFTKHPVIVWWAFYWAMAAVGW